MEAAVHRVLVRMMKIKTKLCGQITSDKLVIYWFIWIQMFLDRKLGSIKVWRFLCWHHPYFQFLSYIVSPSYWNGLANIVNDVQVRSLILLKCDLWSCNWWLDTHSFYFVLCTVLFCDRLPIRWWDTYWRIIILTSDTTRLCWLYLYSG